MIAVVPGYNPILNTLNLVVDNVRRREYKKNSLSITGPGAFYDGVNPYVDKEGYKGKIKILKSCYDKDNYVVFFDPEFGDVAYFGYPGYYDENYYYKYSY